MQILFNQHPFCGLDNEFRVYGAVVNGKPPWEWDRTVALQRILSECCEIEQERRPSIDSVLRELHLIMDPISEKLAKVTISDAQEAEDETPTSSGLLDKHTVNASLRQETSRTIGLSPGKLYGVGGTLITLFPPFAPDDPTAAATPQEVSVLSLHKNVPGLNQNKLDISEPPSPGLKEASNDSDSDFHRKYVHMAPRHPQWSSTEVTTVGVPNVIQPLHFLEEPVPGISSRIPDEVPDPRAVRVRRGPSPSSLVPDIPYRIQDEVHDTGPILVRRPRPRRRSPSEPDVFYRTTDEVPHDRASG